MTHAETTGPTPLPLPSDTSLPFFAYGALKPAEIAHEQIRAFLASEPTSTTVSGSLWLRDGLPLLKSAGGGTVQGYVLRFRDSDAAQAYHRICAFEPRKHYKWGMTEALLEPPLRVNVLVGKQLDRGRAVPAERNAWSLADDPVFSHGLEVVRRVIQLDAVNEFVSAPPDAFDWDRFFRLQMGYLLLWSAIERYSALLSGPHVDPLKRIMALGQYEPFQRALGQVLTRTDQVSDTRDPTDTYKLSPSDPAMSLKYYYQIRNNLSHRGKGAWHDGELVRQSLRELEQMFTAVLQASTSSAV